MSGRVAVALFASLLVLGSAGCGRRDRPSRPPDLVLITLDTFRADRAGCYGNPSGLTPALDRALRTGTIARNAYAPAPLTAPSHATMFTAKEPYAHEVRENGLFRLEDAHRTLAEHLSGQGFKTAGFIAAFPLESRFGFARGFEKYDETLGPAGEMALYYAERPARDVVDALLAWLDGMQPSDRLFLWAHFFDAHHPYRPPRPYSALPGRSPYDREIRSVDAALGRLLNGIAGRDRAALVAIVSDHGEGLGEHRELSHGILLYEETMRGLFGLAAPREARLLDALPRIHEPLARYADLAPTLLDILALPPLPDAEGTPLAEGPPANGIYGETYYPMLHYRWSPLLCWREERWAYIHGPSPQLFDRIADPGEKTNVVDAHREIAAECRERIEERRSEPASPMDGLDDAAREKLAALGYVAVAGGTHDPSKDPNDLIDSVNNLFRGMTLVLEGNPRAALPYLQNAYRDDPENATAVFHLANCFREVGEYGTAITYYRRAIDLDPRIGEAWAHLAVLRWERGDRDVAQQLLKEGLSKNPQSFALHVAAGELALEVGRWDEAEKHFDSAVDIEPHRIEPWHNLATIAERRGNLDEARRLRERATALAGKNRGGSARAR